MLDNSEEGKGETGVVGVEGNEEGESAESSKGAGSVGRLSAGEPPSRLSMISERLLVAPGNDARRACIMICVGGLLNSAKDTRRGCMMIW